MMVLVNLDIPVLTLSTWMHPFANRETKTKLKLMKKMPN